MIPPAECQQDPAPIKRFEAGPLPPPAQALDHARAVADQALAYADVVRTEAEERRLVDLRCAANARRTVEEQLQNGEPR